MVATLLAQMRQRLRDGKRSRTRCPRAMKCRTASRPHIANVARHGAAAYCPEVVSIGQGRSGATGRRYRGVIAGDRARRGRGAGWHRGRPSLAAQGRPIHGPGWQRRSMATGSHSTPQRLARGPAAPGRRGRGARRMLAHAEARCAARRWPSASKVLPQALADVPLSRGDGRLKRVPEGERSWLGRRRAQSARWGVVGPPRWHRIGGRARCPAKDHWTVTLQIVRNSQPWTGRRTRRLPDGNTDTRQPSGRLIRGVNLVIQGRFRVGVPPAVLRFYTVRRRIRGWF